MDALNTEAIDALASAIASLLPATPPPLTPTVLVIPTRVVPTGLGGFVGINENPVGQIFGRRIAGTVLVTAKASNIAGVDDAVDGVMKTLLTADRQTLVNAGILQLSVDSVGPKPSATPPGAPERDITLRVLFEHLKLPEAGEGIIEEIPINVTLK